MKNHNPFAAGVPDCWYSGSKGDIWVEFKFVVLPKRPETSVAVGLSELQKKWLRDRYAEGRCVAVIVGCKEGGVWLPGLTWDTSLTCHQFRLKLEDRKKIGEHIALNCATF